MRRWRAGPSTRADVSHATFALELDAADMASDGFHPGEPVYRACGEALAAHVARLAIATSASASEKPPADADFSPT